MIYRILTILAAVAMLGLGAGPRPAEAQEVVFIQIEAQPSLARARDRAQDYASFLPDVAGFSLGGGWYGIALGPYVPDQALSRLAELRRQGQIPRDAYVAVAQDYGRQFWPVGAQIDRTTPVSPGAGAPAAQDSAAAAQPAVPEVPVEPADETPREARASEAQLSRAEREELQIALRWAGYYNAAIDGAFGRGTRNSMAGWQEANNFEPTGVLTTRQRAVLLQQYNAVLDGMGLTLVREERAGIAMQLPMGVLEFDAYESPFVRYRSRGDLGAQALLISQPGDQATLFGLYDIMQTLEIVPPEGPRDRNRASFTIEGRNDRIVSYTEARLVDGNVKGFTLVWPANDEERRSRVLDKMRGSFDVLDGVLDPGAIDAASQSVDLVAGLEIRKPLRASSGFYVDAVGHVITPLATTEGCGRITLDEDIAARVLARDTRLGLALLAPEGNLAPPEIASLRDDIPRLQSEIAVSGYSYGGLLGAPTLTFGTLADLRGLQGEEGLKRLALNALPGDAGGPVLDTGGAVLGMLLPKVDGARQLPDEVSFAANAATIRALLAQAGVTPRMTQGDAAMAPEDLSNVAAGMTVLVSCWE